MADYYAVLEVQQTATAAEIHSAYRRMALLHHPDKNLENKEAATERFQELQQAYETLSNDTRRRQYDASRNAVDRNDGPFGNHDPFADLHRRYQDLEAYMREEAMRRAAWYHEVRQAQQAHHEELCKTRREELERRTREKTKEREAKQEAKKVQEAETRRAQKEAFDQESRAQRARWQREGAVTGEDKVKSCLHSDFCTKIPQQKKFKCGECRYKRGMTAFACPHCALWLCQLCLTKFAERRARDGKSKPAQQQPATFKQ